MNTRAVDHPDRPCHRLGDGRGDAATQDKKLQDRMTWMEDPSEGIVRFMGAAELLGGIIHVRRKDPVAAVVPSAVLGLLSLLVA